MDDTAPEIQFTKTGCNFCDRAKKSLKDIKAQKNNLLPMLEQIKRDGEGKEYDCLMGLSGGLDSSTTFDWAIENGLRVLAFTLDNSYNTPQADHNVMALIDGRCEFLKIQVDQEVYTKLQDAFFQAGVKIICQPGIVT